MSDNWILGIPFGLSVFFLLAAVIVGMCLHRAELRPKGTSLLGRIFTAFRIFLILFFFATMSAVYPISRFDLAVSGVVDIVYAIISSLINTFRLFFMAGDFVSAIKVINSCINISSPLSISYLVYLGCIYFVAPVFTLSFILSLFRDISSTLRYFFSRRANLYLFSELNERSLALAEDIAEKNRDKRRTLIVFTDVFSRGEERTEELIASAKRIGALCMKKDITELGLNLKKKHKQKLYFIGENEDENIQQALALINHHANGRFDTEHLELYVFSNTVESETLLTSVYGMENINKQDRSVKAMKIRRVNENRNLALQEMLNHPIFDDASEKDGTKQIGIVIVGLGGYGTELLKAICWCSQMPGYALNLHVFEKRKENGEGKIKAIAPELMAYNHNKKPFEAQYDIEFHYNDVETAEFIENIKNLNGITKIYVSLGDDEKNIEIAMRIRMALGQVSQKSDCRIPHIYPIVYSAAKSETILPTYELKFMNKGTGIFLIGGLQTRYTLDNIEQSELEREALRFHKIYQVGEVGVRLFNQYEYYRNSSMAKVVYQRLRREKCAIKKMNGESEEAKCNNDILRDYDHRRWNTYMRAEGYVYASIVHSDKISKLHPNLLSFQELPETAKTKEDF